MRDEGPGQVNPAFTPEEGAGTRWAEITGYPKALESDKAADKRERWSIIKNVIVISVAFLLNFTSFNSMANLQSSINKNLGTTSLWVLYASLVLSCAFVPTFLIRKLKCKWTVAVCILTYSAYIGAQFYPSYYTLVPTAILLGFGAAPMWSAKCTYLTQVGNIYGNYVGEKGEVIITRFFGIFFLFFQSSQIWGNLISSLVLSSGEVEVSRSPEFLEHCGSNFCPSFAANLTLPSTPRNETGLADDKVMTLSSIYLGCSVASSLIIVLLVDSLTRYGDGEMVGSSPGKTGLQMVLATFNHLRNPYQLLIIPLTIWSGIEQGFLAADFTAAYVTCTIGVHNVGYTYICYGVCDALFSITFSPVVKRFGRIPIFTFGALLNSIMIVILLAWSPVPGQYLVMYVIAACWGIADAIWQTQINALYGVIFPGESEAAFSNYRLWESLGFIVAFVLSGWVCIDVRIYVLIGVLASGMAGYYAIEGIERRGGLKKAKDGTVIPLDRLIIGDVD